MQEVLTFQLGPYATDVSSHLWNLSDASGSSSSSVLHRGSETRREPRALVFDDAFTGGLESCEDPVDDLAVADGVDQDQEKVDDRFKWPHEQVTIHRQPSSRPHNRLLNTRSILPPVAVGPTFASGSSAWTPALASDVMEERVRWLVEECDRLDSLVVAVDWARGGWSGFACRLVEALHDELPKRCVLSFAYNSSALSGGGGLVDSALATSTMLDGACGTDLMVPVDVAASSRLMDGGDRRVLFDVSRSYQSSAVMACALDTLLLPGCVSADGLMPSQISSLLTLNSPVPVAHVMVDMPLELDPFTSRPVSFTGFKYLSDTRLPAQYQVYRGVDASAIDIGAVADFEREKHHTVDFYCDISRIGLAYQKPFPQILLDSKRQVDKNSRAIPMFSSLVTCPAYLEELQRHRKVLSGIKPSSRSDVDFGEASERLGSLIDRYL